MHLNTKDYRNVFSYCSVHLIDYERNEMIFIGDNFQSLTIQGFGTTCTCGTIEINSCRMTII